MATINVTINDTEYDQMMAVLDAMRAKLAPLKAPLALALQAEPEKVKAFIQTENGRFLREVYRVWTDLNMFMDAIGLERDE